MIDVIIACLAAGGLPVLVLLSRSQQTVLSGNSGILAALSVPALGGLPGGIACLLLAQGLAVALVFGGIRLYCIRWVFRKCYSNSKDAGAAVEKVSLLPLSPLMKRKLRRDITLQFMRGVWARREARMKQNEAK